MVDIVRRKNARIVPEEVYKGDINKYKAAQAVGGAISELGAKAAEYGGGLVKKEESVFQERLEQLQKVQADEKKAFDASDKLVASDMAGRLKNDLLRWNLAQRENNPSYIGTREHESAMRAEYDRLANKYNVGLGEVGMADFQEKTQGYVNTFLDNDIKWAYQQKIKQGEESAKASAQQIEQTATLHGANGDVQGFKDSYAEMSAPLSEYIATASPENASRAMGELGEKSITSFILGMAETDPVKAKAIIDSPENFKEIVPDEMLQTVSDAMLKQQEEALKDQIILVNAGVENAKKGSPYYKELEKKKKELERGLKKLGDSDVGEESLESIRQSVGRAVKPVLEKAVGEKLLLEKQKAIAERVDKFGNFLMMPTPENLKFFEQDNQMSYVPDEKNMTELPAELMPLDAKQKETRTELIKNMMKYKENFGKVSLVEISDYKGTKQMFDDLKATAQIDADKDGNVDNVLLKAIVGCNNAHQSEIAQKDFDAYVTLQNRIVYDQTFKKQINEFINNTKDYLPHKFWDSAGASTATQRRELNDKMESKTRDVLLSVLHEWQKGEMSNEDITKMYIDGIERAYNETVSDFLGFDMGRVVRLYKETGKPVFAKIHNVYYEYHGTDPNGDPIWFRAVDNPKAIKATNVEPALK